MPKVSSLYELIKKISEEEKRPLKIVSDWDDCLQPFRPYAFFLSCPDKVKGGFKEFFDRFWEKSSLVDVITPGEDNKTTKSGNQIGNYSGDPEEKKAIEEFEAARAEARKDIKNYNFYSIPNWYFKTPWLSTAEDLLKCLKEGLISELILTSSYPKGENTEYINESAKTLTEEKIARIKKTFGNFPQVKCCMEGYHRKAKGGFYPHRWEIIRDKWSDFDLFIDDNPFIIKECCEKIPGSKKYAINDYGSNRQVEELQRDNVYFVATHVSTLKDSDFAHKAEQNEQVKYSLEETKRQNSGNVSQPKSSDYNPWIIWGFVVLLVLSVILVIYFTLSKKKKSKK